GMVELEFENIWRQYEAEKAREAQPEAVASEAASDAGEAGSAETATDEAGVAAPAPEPQNEAGVGAAQDGERQAGSTEDEETLKVEYRRIAERRGRLGMVRAEGGRRNKVQCTRGA